MVRWEPGTLERLQLAALELFEERGYDRTTVADIAARAGLTERTFYRHYSDKREVLVAGSAELTSVLTTAVADQPDGSPPLTVVEAALTALGPLFDARRPFSLRRQVVIASSPDLQERELAKLDALTEALDGALRARGVQASTARLVATIGVAVFHVAFAGWMADPDGRGFAGFVREALDGLRAEVAGATRPAPATRPA